VALRASQPQFWGRLARRCRVWAWREGDSMTLLSCQVTIGTLAVCPLLIPVGQMGHSGALLGRTTLLGDQGRRNLKCLRPSPFAQPGS